MFPSRASTTLQKIQVCRGLSGSYSTETVVQFAADSLVQLPAE